MWGGVGDAVSIWRAHDNKAGSRTRAAATATGRETVPARRGNVVEGGAIR